MKKIAVGDLGEFWYGDYKEPFEQLEGAVEGYPRGVLLKTDDGRLLCAYCRDDSEAVGKRGRTFHNLGKHAQMAHGLPAREYKREIGLLQKSALVSERGRLQRTATALRRARTGQTNLAEMSRRAASSRPAPKQSDPVGRQTPEHLNRTGRCYAQVIAVARQIAVRQKLSLNAFSKFGIGNRTLMRYFGDQPLTRLGRLVGSRPWTYTETELVDVLRSLAASLGRTPSESDLRRFGLPPASTFIKRFGGWAAACRVAGLNPNLPVVLDDDLTSRILTAYAVTMNADRVGATLHISPARIRTVLARYDLGGPLVRYSHAERLRQQTHAAEIARRVAGWPNDEAA